jgi:opacity protein-like surface antigen
MTIALKITSLSAALVLAATAVSAQDGYYGGVGLSFGHMISKGDFASGASTDDYGSVSLIGGYRRQVEKNFWAMEAQLDFPISDELTSAGIPCSAGASAPYGCEVDGTLRLRGVTGTKINDGLEVYATAGFVIVSGEAANSATTTDSVIAGGFSIGVGLQQDITPTLKIRGELNHDMAKIGLNDISSPGGSFDPSFVHTSLQISLVKSF